MQIGIVLVDLSTENEHIIVVITASCQPYDLPGFIIVLLDIEYMLIP